MDDVVLQYMVSILQELENSAASADLFDVEQFTEMMEAYLPGFQAVDRSVWCICHGSDLKWLKFLNVATFQKLVISYLLVFF